MESNYPKPFPNDLRCEPDFQNDKGQTLAMYIFERWHTDCEPWMQHDVNICNGDGCNAFMVWLKANKSEPPEWTHKNLDPLFQVQRRWSSRIQDDFPIRNTSSNPGHICREIAVCDYYQEVPLMFWIQYTDLPIPEWLLVPSTTITNKGWSAMFPSWHIQYVLNTATYASRSGIHWVALEFTDKFAKLICSQASNFGCFRG